MNLHIMPVKCFLKLNVEPNRSAAIISTSFDIDKKTIYCPYALAEYMDFDYESHHSFSAEQASTFVQFIKQLDKSTTELYVCCDAGESRSPAIAAAIHRWLEQSDDYIWKNARYHPNVLCFCRMLEAFNLSITDAEIDGLIQTNRTVFKNAIKKTKQVDL